MTVRANLDIIRYGFSTQIYVTGGTGPYTYTVLASGAGGSISVAGLYLAPTIPNGNTRDTIRATDSLGAIQNYVINVLTPLEMICSIIQSGLALSIGQVMIYNQKWNIPTDQRLYVTVEILSCKPFGNNNKSVYTNGDLTQVQSTNFLNTLQIDVWSRSTLALNRKEEVLMSLRSNYAQRLMDAFSFYIAPVSTSFTNLSNIDGAAIPYRFSISVNLQYAVELIGTVDIFDSVLGEIYTDPESDNEPIVFT